jgi:hypothetical protein
MSCTRMGNAASQESPNTLQDPLSQAVGAD